MDTTHGRIIQTPITVNDNKYKGFSIPGVTSIPEAWFKLGRLTNCIEYEELHAKPEGDWIALSGSMDEIEDDWIMVESLGTVMGDF